MGMKNVLILSHTGACSQFKIGSHHYANKLSLLGYNVYYSGVPISLLHKILRRKKTGTQKINDTVNNLSFNSVFPITLKKNPINKIVNNLYWTFNKGMKEIPFFDYVICDYPYFYPLLSFIKYNKLVYRPTDDYYSMSGGKVTYYEKRIIEKAESIVTSEVVKENLMKRHSNVINENIYVIENGYDAEFFYIKNKMKRNGCVYIGALDDRFSFDSLNYFAEQFPDISFDIYGPFEKKDRNVIESSKRKNISFKGALEYEYVADVLNKYKIGILPLVKNGKNKGRSPMKLWEYYSCGLSVVYSNINHIDNDLFFRYESESKENMYQVFLRALNYEQEYTKDNALLLKNSWDFKTKELINIMGCIR